ncbi:MAG: alkaline phosphatase [Anaerolineae bacterium]
MKGQSLRRRILVASVVGLVLLILSPPVAATEPLPPRIILFIGDGMGPSHRRAAQWYAVGEDGVLAMDAMPFRGSTGTTNVDGAVTDSAAAGTAIATGVKVRNGVISVDADGAPLVTILEQAQDEGLAVGLATNTQMSHATPAAFAAHVENRSEMRLIASQMITQRVNVLLGGGRSYFEPDLITEAVDAGYTYVDDADGLNAIDPGTTTHLLGLFAADGMPRPYSPTLASMTQTAIDVLSQDPDGFFLMVEGGQIDWASHANEAANVISDTLGFDAAVAVGRAYAAQAENVLVIVTADHETGGMRLSSQATGALDEDGPFPIAGGGHFYVNWSSTKHTTATVPTTAQGPWSHLLAGAYENTYLYEVMHTALTAPFRLTLEGVSTGFTFTAYPFTATVHPLTNTLPFTFTWTTDEEEALFVSRGLSSTVALSWTHPAHHTLTATVESPEVTLVATHTIEVAQRWFDLYLPLILRSSED